MLQFKRLMQSDREFGEPKVHFVPLAHLLLPFLNNLFDLEVLDVIKLKIDLFLYLVHLLLHFSIRMLHVLHLLLLQLVYF